MRRRDDGTPRRRTLGGALLVPVLLVSGLVATSVVGEDGSPAIAAPGNPGVPGPVTEVWHEGLENNTAGAASSLRDYVGESGERYTADPYWLRQDQCNGVVVRYAGATFPSGFCTTGNGAQNNVRRLADVLGQVEAGMVGSANPGAPFNGSTEATRANHAITAWTGSVAGANNGITFQTPAFDLTGRGARFYTASVNVAEVSCTYQQGVNNSRLNFSLVAGTTELGLTNTPIRACTDPAVRYYTSPNLAGGWGNGGAYVAAGRFYADSSFLVDPAVYPTLALRMRNAVGASQGNDFAYDEVRLYDATPQLDKSFSPTRVPVNGVSTLTFTVTNTVDLAEKRGWSFTDTLPSGLVVADPSNIGGTCVANTSADPGSGVVTITDGVLATDEASCTITVDVTSASPGPADDSPVVYANCAENMTLSALDPPACAEVEFYTEPHLTVAKESDGSGASRVGDTVTYTVTGTNDGTQNYTVANPAVVIDDLSNVLDDGTLVDGSIGATIDGVPVAPPTRDGDRLVWQGPLDVGKNVVITYQVQLAGGGDMRVTNTAFPSSGTYDSNNPPPTPACGEGGSACTDFSLPGITIDKFAVDTVYTWGTPIRYRFTVTNTGAVPLTDVAVNDVSFDGSGTMSAVTCPQTTLQPQQAMTCTATYTASGPDTDQGSLNNTATASGNPPAGERLTSAPDAHRIPARQEPAIELDKYSDANEITHEGQQITYRFRVYNRGNVTLDPVVIEELEFTGTGDPLTVSCPRTRLEGYADMLCSAPYTVTQEDVDNQSLTNTARATGTAPDGREVSDDDTVETPGDSDPGLTLEKRTFTEDLVLGDEVTYWFRVVNSGNMTLEWPTVSEVSFSGSGEMTPVVCEYPEGDDPMWPTWVLWCSATYTVTQADVDSGRVDNTAIARSQTVGEDPQPVDSNEASQSIPHEPSPGVSLEKVADPQEYVAGQQVTYTFRITNTGDVSLGNLRVDELAFDGSGEMSAIVCPEGRVLAPEESADCTATYTPTQADVDKGTLKNTAVAYGNQPGGGEVMSDPAEEEIVSDPAPALTIEKTPSTDTLVPGETITYTFVVTNTGNVTLTDVGVAEGSFNGNNPMSAIDCPADETASLAPGDSVTCTATYTVHQWDLDQGNVTNSATAEGTPPGGGVPIQSPPDEARVAGDRNPGIELEKTADTDTLVLGETVTYSFRVTNTGNVTLRGIIVTEDEWTGNGDSPEIVCPADGVDFLAPGRSVTCTAEYVVTQADVDAGRVYNQASASGKPRDLDPIFTDPSDVTLTVDPDPSLTLVKSSDTTELVPGETVTYTFVVTNDGNVTMNDIAIREDAFTGSGQMSAITCAPEEAQQSLAPGEQLECHATYEVTQTDVDRGTVDNTASALGTPPGADQPVASDPSEVRIPQAMEPGIEMEKSASTDTLVAGETITYSFRVTNTGNVTLTDVRIDEGAFTGSGDVSEVSCPDAAAALAPGRTITCTATYVVTQADVDAGSVQNTATAVGSPPRGEDPVTSPPSRTEATADHDPSIEIVKTSDAGSFVAGQTITYSFAVTNTGNVTLTDVTVDEGAFSGSGDMSAVECPAEASSLAPGETVTCTATYVATQADVDRGSVTNSATAGGTPPGAEDPIVSPPSEARVPSDRRPGISLVKSADRTELVAGETITYSFVVTNTGNVTLTDVAVAEGSFSGAGEMSAIDCPDETASLAPGEQVICTATYVVQQADVDAGTIENSATATGTPPGGAPIESPPSTVQVPQDPAPSLSLVKSADPAQAGGVGQEITYSFVVTNTGNQTLTDVSVAEGAFSGSGELSAIECPDDDGRLVPGEFMTCTVTYVLTQADVDAGGVTNTATAVGTPPGGDPIESPPSEVVVTVDPAPGISVVKSADRTEVTVGDTITYSFVVTNTGNVTLTEVGVNEVSFNGAGELSEVTCPEGAASLAPGEQMVCTATYVVQQADVDAGTLDNVATATGTPPDGDPIESPPSEVHIPQEPRPGISLVKTAEPSEGAQVGETITYSFTVTNTGNVTLTDVTVDESEFSGTGELSEIVCPEAMAALAPGQIVVCTATYVLTQADAEVRRVTNSATVTGTPPNGAPPVTSPPSEAEVTIDPAAPALTLVKSADRTELVVGETITYSFVVTNVGGVTLSDVSVVEGAFSGTGELSAVSCPAGASSLAPGDQIVCTATYVVTQEDVDAGTIENSATATGTPPGGDPIESPPSDVRIPQVPAPGLAIVKTADTDLVYSVGQVVTYSFAVTNTGNITLTDVRVDEGEFSGTGTLSEVVCPAEAAALRPGETMICTATYTVQAADLAQGELSNVATVTGNPPSPVPPVVSPPSEVRIPVLPAPVPPLPVTGGELSMGIVLLALLLLVGGAGFAGVARRRRTTEG